MREKGLEQLQLVRFKPKGPLSDRQQQLLLYHPQSFYRRFLAAGIILFTPKDGNDCTGQQRITKRQRWVVQLAKVIPDTELRRVQLLPALLMLFQPASQSFHERRESTYSSVSATRHNLYNLTARQPFHQQALLLRGAAIILLRQWALLADEALLLLRRLLHLQLKPLKIKGGLSVSSDKGDCLQVDSDERGELLFAGGGTFQKKIGIRRKRARTSSPKHPQLLAADSKPWEINPASQQSSTWSAKEPTCNQVSCIALDVTTLENDAAGRSFAEIGHMVMQQYFQRHEPTPTLVLREKQREDSGYLQRDGLSWPVRPCHVVGTMNDPSFGALWDGYRSPKCDFRQSLFDPLFETARGAALPAGNPFLSVHRDWISHMPSLEKQGNEAGDVLSVDATRVLLMQDARPDVDPHGEEEKEGSRVQQLLQLEQKEGDARASKGGIETESPQGSSAAVELRETQEKLDRWGLPEDHDCWDNGWVAMADEVGIEQRDHHPQAEYLEARARLSRDELFETEHDPGEMGFTGGRQEKIRRLREKQLTTADRKANKITFDATALFHVPFQLDAVFEKLLRSRVTAPPAAANLPRRAEKPALNALLTSYWKPLDSVRVKSLLVRGALLCPERGKAVDPWLAVLASEVEENWTPAKEPRIGPSRSDVVVEAGTAAAEIWKKWRCPWWSSSGLTAESGAKRQRKSKDSEPSDFPHANASERAFDDSRFPFRPSSPLQVDDDDFALPFYDEDRQVHGLLTSRPPSPLWSATSRRVSLDSAKGHKGVAVRKQDSLQFAHSAPSTAIGYSDPIRRDVLRGGGYYAEVLGGIFGTASMFKQGTVEDQALLTPLGTTRQERSATQEAEANVVDSSCVLLPQQATDTHHSSSCDKGESVESYSSSSHCSNSAAGTNSVREGDQVKESSATACNRSQRTSHIFSTIPERAEQLQQTKKVTDNEKTRASGSCCWRNQFDQRDNLARECAYHVDSSRRSSYASPNARPLSTVSSSISLSRGRAACGDTCSSTENFMDFLLDTLRREVRNETSMCRKAHAAAGVGEEGADAQQLLEGMVIKLPFEQLVPVDGITSITAAKAFHHLLVLHMRGSVTLEQDQPQQQYLPQRKEHQHTQIQFPTRVYSLFVCVERKDLLSSRPAVVTGSLTPGDTIRPAWDSGNTDEITPLPRDKKNSESSRRGWR